MRLPGVHAQNLRTDVAQLQTADLTQRPEPRIGDQADHERGCTVVPGEEVGAHSFDHLWRHRVDLALAPLARLPHRPGRVVVQVPLDDGVREHGLQHGERLQHGRVTDPISRQLCP